LALVDQAMLALRQQPSTLLEVDRNPRRTSLLLRQPGELLVEQRLELVGESAECCSPILQLLDPLRVPRRIRERPLVHVRMVIGVQEQPAIRAALEQAKSRLDRLQLYPVPVRIGRVSI